MHVNLTLSAVLKNSHPSKMAVVLVDHLKYSRDQITENDTSQPEGNVLFFYFVLSHNYLLVREKVYQAAAHIVERVHAY